MKDNLDSETIEKVSSKGKFMFVPSRIDLHNLIYKISGFKE